MFKKKSPEAAELASALHPSDIIVHFSSRSFGKGELNPVDFVKFYSSDNPNTYPSEHSTVLPEFFCEHCLFAEVVKAGYLYLDQKLLESDAVELIASNALPVTTLPTTDRI
ncbi:hypothetical protein CVT25_009149 [Psilocybe cyanescens]|uniref:Uncharacterized protein n=1 Tax=Psilocybe cyanescens TaxID=93625 RepID=A0A409XDV8_PSICY|nr:hypothetical protein CVT25_009149 [Psilocybe cyanescens]